jgi:hypothetical protein
LELRGILTREAHPELVHLLPPDEPPRAPPQRKRAPVRDSEIHVVIDLVSQFLV